MSDSQPNDRPDSRLIPILREGAAVIQMILFKEIKGHLAAKHPEQEAGFIGLLAGALVNRLFASDNPEPKFQEFLAANRGLIEQELLGLAQELPQLRDPLSDTLRILTLCDQQEEIQGADLLSPAEALGLLNHERDLPLPSTFMETVRSLGAGHGLIIPPSPIDPEQEQGLKAD